MKKQIIFLPLLLLFLLLLLGIGLVAYPIASSHYAERHQSQVYTQYQEIIEKSGSNEIEARVFDTPLPPKNEKTKHMAK